MTQLTDLSASRLAEGIRRREFSSREVVQAHLERIARVNPLVNAVVQLNPLALAQAQQADDALARCESLGPLHGVPFTAKDVYDTAGIISAAGLEERRVFIPAQDAVVVARMRAAGAILLGKTNCPPGGGGLHTDNPVYGRTRNPWNPALSAGGSSGGEAAIIAARGSPCGLGSDSGGSIRQPAHFNGVAGLRPTCGRVPNTGAYDQPGGLSDPRTSCGCLACSVHDLALILGIINGPDGRDAGVAPVPLGDYRAFSLVGQRAAWFADGGLGAPTPATLEALATAVRNLQEGGMQVEEASPPGLNQAEDITQRYWHMDKLVGEGIWQLWADWDAFRSHMLQFMSARALVVCPVSAAPACPPGPQLDASIAYTLPWSLSNNPVVVVRTGTSAEGRPIGVQLVAPPWREDIALAAGACIEQALGEWPAPPLSM